MQTQNLQIIPRGIKPIIKASQFDVGREFQLKLYDGAVAYTPPTGTALRLDGVKPDGTVFSYTENLSLSGSTITVTTTTQMTILEGIVQCEIRMTKDNDDIGTINFDLMVEKSPINETTDLSQTEIPALVILARMQMENAEAWAVGTKDGEPVSPDDPQYENSAKYWAQQVGGQTQDAEAWAVGTKDGVPVTSGDPQYHNNAKYYSDGVHTDAQAAAASALVSEGYATGKQNGTDVTSTSPYYHNNAAYFAGEAADNATTAANAALRAEAAVVLEPYIGANGNWYVYDFSTNAYVDTGVDATGATGNGIASIAKTSTSGLVDTYTITYTDNTTTTFTVTNGADGQNGQDGATGNGIASITKTGTSGLVDTYTILYTDGTSTTFTVTNGQNGTGAGDMLAADYDPTQAVYNEGGIVAYVAAQLSGFSTSLSGLTDVALTSLAAGQSLVYDATEQKLVNGSISASNVNYANTTSGLTATKVQAAIDEVAAENQTLTSRVTDISEEIADMNNVLGAKNLLPNNATSITKNGVTFTVNSDGSVTANGTASAYTQFDLNSGIEYKEGKYALNGCPSGGGSSAYVIWVRNLAVTVGVTDGGNGATLNVTNADTFKASIIVYSGAIVNNLTFYPMLRPASIEDDTYEPYSMTNREMTPYVQTISNPNLLDNPWFTINQRGQSSYSGASEQRYCLDRWIFTSPLNVTVNSDYSISIENTSNDVVWFGELLEMPERGLKGGETVTQSIKLSNGVIYKATAQIPVNVDFVDTFIRENGIESIRIQRLNANQYFAVFFIMGNSTVNIVATKLELGNVSTLAQDTAPNYATELLKCQRYFQALAANTNVNYSVGMGQARTTTKVEIHVPLACQMRAQPTIIFSGGIKLRNASNVISVINIAVECVGRNEILLAMEATGLTAGAAYSCFTYQDGVLQLSADL